MLAKVTAPFLIHFTVLEIAGVIILCYSLALSYGHVPAWLPMISDCAVLPPEKYPFRLGFVAGSLLLGVNVIIVHFSYASSKYSLSIGMLSCFGLSVVAVVNEAEDNTIHSTAAVLFFILYEIYMIMMTWKSMSEKSVCLYSVVVKMFSSILAGLALIAFIVMSFNWGKYQLYIAVCEWFGTLCILVYQWTFALDLSKVSICEIQQSEDVVPISFETKLPPSYHDATKDCKLGTS